MRKMVLAVLASALFVVVGLVTAPAASAHNPCDYRCNTVQNVSGGTGIGIYNWLTDSKWAWILPARYRTDGYPLYQADVDGFYIGPGYCFDVWQSNDNRSWGYWGRGKSTSGWKFETRYWNFNQVDTWAC